MPIKFRCNYCHQFLGISRNRAGSVVDCPTCGRSIRVPELDGRVAPLPAPGLNTEDSHLARALDELAALAQVNLSEPVVATDLEEPDEEIPQPLPEPVPVEIPVPMTVPTVTAAVAVFHGESAAPPSDLSAVSDVLKELAMDPPPESPPPGQVGRAEQAPADGRAASAWSAEPAHWVNDASRPESAGSRSYAVRTPHLAWFVASPLLALLCGWWLGQMMLAAPIVDVEPVVPGVQQPLADGEFRVEGRIAYTADSGDVQPDVGAAVLVLPRTWDGASRLQSVGLRPGDAESDRKIAAAVAAAMGGSLSWTDAEGRFRSTLPQRGAYRWVVLSRLASRAAAGPLSATDDATLKLHLQDPGGVVGRRAFHLEDIEILGNDVSVRNHEFPRE